MRIVFVLLSPTFGMHQYTADLANTVIGEGDEAALVTTTAYIEDRYSPAVVVATPVPTRDTGFSLAGARVDQYLRVARTIQAAAPDVVHITGVHAWNVPLVRQLRRARIPVIHTLHDLDPHHGVRFARLIRLWNRLIIDSADHLLVHGQRYAERLTAQGLHPDRLTCTPLLHSFLSFPGFANLGRPEVDYGHWGLFFGRFERYKGTAQLIAAWRLLAESSTQARLVLAGPGNLDNAAPLPPTIEIRNRLIQDAEAIDLFRQCGVLILPYLDASQSALAAAAYCFAKPVIVTDVGALSEYVQPGITGWIVPAGNATALAGALGEALMDSQRLRQMGEAGREWYENQRKQERETLVAMYRRVSKREHLP